MKIYKKYLILTFILLTLFYSFIPLNVKGITNDINYTFFNDNLYNSTDIDFYDNVNMRDSGIYNSTYPATYNFKDDTVGTFPDGWVDSSGVGSTAVIASEWQGHRKVFQGTCAGGGSVYRVKQTFTAQVDGDIEFWIGSTDTTNVHTFYLSVNGSLGAGDIATYIYTSGDTLVARKGDGVGGSTGVSLGAITDNMIAHVRIHFDTATDTFSCWRDETLYVDTQNFINDNTFGATDLNSITIIGPNVAAAIAYFDAIGYSWGKVIEFIGFDNDIVGNEPIDWNINNDVSCTSLIKASLDGRNKVLEMFDNNGSGISNTSTQFNTTIINDITIDIATSDISQLNFESKILFIENKTTIISLIIDGHDLYYDDGSGSPFELIKAPFLLQNNEFEVLKIIFNDLFNTFDCYINDNLEGNNLLYTNNSTNNIDTLRFMTDNTALTSYSFFQDNININQINYNIGDNLIPELELNGYKEVDKFDFDMITPNNLYDIGYDNPSGWTDVETGQDHTNIAQDNTDIVGGSRGLNRVVEIEGSGNTHELTGLDRSFSVSEGIIEVSMNFNMSEVENDNGNFNMSIYSNNLDKQVEIGLYFPNSAVFGGQLTYLHSNGSYVNLNEYIYSKIASNQDINYSIYIDTFVILEVSTNGSLGYSTMTYYFSLINSTNEGLGKIDIISNAFNDVGNDNIYNIKTIGVYINGSSLSDDFGYLPLQVYTQEPTFWHFIANNLLRIKASGTFSMLTASFDDWILEGNMEIISNSIFHNNTLEVFNLYFTEFVHFPSVGIYQPIIVFFITGGQFNISSITLDGIKFKDDTPHEFAFASYDSGGVNNNESYFYIESNILKFKHNTNQNNILEFIQMEFIIGGLNSNNSAISYTTSKSENALGFFRVNYVATSSIFEIPSVLNKYTLSLLPNSLSIISYIVLITDNNDNTVSGLTTGTIHSFSLLFTEEILSTVITISLIGVLIPLIIILIPSLGFKVRFGRFMFLPIFLLMSLICVIGAIIPFWLFFIIVLSTSLFIFQDKKEVR